MEFVICDVVCPYYWGEMELEHTAIRDRNVGNRTRHVYSKKKKEGKKKEKSKTEVLIETTIPRSSP